MTQETDVDTLRAGGAHVENPKASPEPGGADMVFIEGGTFTMGSDTHYVRKRLPIAVGRWFLD